MKSHIITIEMEMLSECNHAKTLTTFFVFFKVSVCTLHVEYTLKRKKKKEKEKKE